MRTTIDRAGRLVVPKALRDEIGLPAGEVDVEVDGASLPIRPLSGEGLSEREGRILIPASDITFGDDLVQALRDSARH